MAIDRAATLRNAEKLAQQGKLEPAAAEYLRVVQDNPKDWTTANTLGDLYVRLGQNDKAVEQFTRIADHLTSEGFLPRASALYKKILKLKPDHERALLQMAEIAASQGLLADARAHLGEVMTRRRERKDKRGMAELRVRLGLLDPADLNGRLSAARARVELKDIPGALRDFKAIAAEFSNQQKEADALKVLQEASKVDPSDADIKGLLARRAVAQGDLAGAAEFLTAESAGDDPGLLLVVAGIRLRGGATEEALALASRVLERHPEREAEIAHLGCSVAAETPAAAYGIVRQVVDAMAARGDASAAAALLQEFATRAPHHIPALHRLVEVSIDGGLEAVMYQAQAQLADAYLAGGMAAEAHFLAEDLVAREPWEPANIERLRKALELLGEPDPAGLIAERLSGRSPFMTTDLSGDSEGFPDFDAPAALAEPPPAEAAAPVEPPAPIRPSGPAAADAPTQVEEEHVEIDLSVVLEAPHESPGGGDAELAGVFQQFRNEEGRKLAADSIDAQYNRVNALRNAGAVEAANELLYAVAGRLEQEGDLAGALAMNMELQAEAGSYRDVNERVDRLSKVQARG